MLKKISLYLAMIVFSSMLFVSCNEDTLTSGDAEITSLSNVIGQAGSELTINGSGFGDTQLATYKVMVGTTAVDAGKTKSWSDSKIVFEIPGGIPASNTATYIQVVAATTTKQVTFYIGNPNPIAPTGLKATSITDSIVHITWTPSEDEGKGIFAGYELVVSNTTNTPIADVTYQVPTNSNPFEIKGLTQGDVYKFELKSKFNAEAKNALSTGTAEVNWSPAHRFEETGNEVPIRVYSTASNFGSGLNLYDNTENAPKIFKIASSPDWQFCLYTTGGAIEFGSATAQNKYSYSAGTPQTAQIADVDLFADNLNEVFLGNAFTAYSFSAKTVNLKEAKYANQNKGVVLVVKVVGTTESNYAKILIKKVAGSFIQGTGDDTYIECVVSYQKEGNVPFARF